MEKRKLLLLIFLLIFFLRNNAHAQARKFIEVGKVRATIFDDGIQSGTNMGSHQCTYERGSYVSDAVLQSLNGWHSMWKTNGTMIGIRNWTDTLGEFWPYQVTGHTCRLSFGPGDPFQFNVPDEMGYTIRRFYRYPPTQVIIDGQHVESPFPRFGDEVNPDTIWGTADVMVECHWRLSNGMDVYQRNLAWSQSDHDDYVIWDLTFVNTGNTNRNEAIELPEQTLDSVIITNHFESLPNDGMYPWAEWTGVTEDHNSRLSYPYIGDSLRMQYLALARKKEGGFDCDNIGLLATDWGAEERFLGGCRYAGIAILFAPKNTSVPQTHPIADPVASNDPAQPSMYSDLFDFFDVLWEMTFGHDTSDYREPYRTMRKGIRGFDDTNIVYCQRVYPMHDMYDVYDTTATGASTFYEQPVGRLGEKDVDLAYFIPRDAPFNGWTTTPKFSIGPYNMEFGDTIRYVRAFVAGSVSRKTSYLLTPMWNTTLDAYDFDWVADMDSASIMQGLIARDPLVEVYLPTEAANLFKSPIPERLNNIAKDYILATGRDSLFKNGMAAQRNFNMNYEIPASPNPPSVFEVSSLPDMIELVWSYESGYEPTDLAGFKIYRAQGGTKFVLNEDGSSSGEWELIDSVGPLEREYEDTEGIVTAFDYYYCITAVNSTGIESGKFLTMTQEPFAARLTNWPGDSLSQCRVVPNPFNLNDNRWGSRSEEYKIAFRDLPPICTIRIFTESGELVKTIEHDDGSGSAFWQVAEGGGWYLTTSKNQRPASGLYIAHIETPTGEWISRKFIIIR